MSLAQPSLVERCTCINLGHEEMVAARRAKGWPPPWHSDPGRPGHCTCRCQACDSYRDEWTEYLAEIACQEQLKREEEERKARELAERERQRKEEQARQIAVRAEKHKQWALEDAAWEARRAESEAAGPPWGVRATANQVQDIRAMAAWTSYHPGDDSLPYFNALYIYQDRLCEMRPYGCSRHPEDPGDCDCDCDAMIRMAPVGRTWRALKDALDRIGATRWELPEDSSRWTKAPPGDEAFMTAAAADYWPGVHHLFGFQPVPFYHSDGHLQIWPGLEGMGGFWGLPQLTAGQGALTASPVTNAIAALMPWNGAMSDLAAATGWQGKPEALAHQVKKLTAELAAAGCRVRKTGERTPDGRRLALWVVEPIRETPRTPQPPGITQ
jgi:hypothetical protein